MLIVAPPVYVVTLETQGCSQATIGGGCPDINICTETCRPCFREVGKVTVSCVAGGGGTPYARCVCDFSDGADCNPPPPPRCPAPWPRLHNTNTTTTLDDRTNIVILNNHTAIISYNNFE